MKKTRKRRKLVPREGNSPRDKYLRKAFNRTEEEFKIAFKEQDEVCFICRRSPVTKNHHLDHDHNIANWKILSEKQGNVWYAWPDGCYPLTAVKKTRLHFMCSGTTKPEALRKTKRKLLRLSCRGILCWEDNRAIQKFRDDEIRMLRASIYIQQYKEFIEGLREKGTAFYE